MWLDIRFQVRANNFVPSLISNISQFSPGAFLIQESKVSRKGQIKVKNYEIFEVVRTNANGGSILTGVHENLSPIFISGGEDETEILVVQCQVSGVDIRLINGYGPQENAKIEDKIEFYSKLDQEVKSGKLFECFVFIEMDANAKVGDEVIEGNPHKMSQNGELLMNFARENSLILCNASDLCEGNLLTAE